MSSFFPEILRYLRVAPWPHATSFKALALSCASGWRALLLLGEQRIIECGVAMLLTCCFAWALALCQLDAFSRFREFQRIREIFARHGYKPKVLTVVRSSRCQRDAAIMAATETGCREKACMYYKQLGYRWYHILPDRVVADPLYLMHPDFLRTTFLPRRNRGRSVPRLCDS
jgi:hypothetical protein